MSSADEHLRQRLAAHLKVLYPDLDRLALAEEIIALMALDQRCFMPEAHKNLWDESDVLLITYGDSILRDGEFPLHTLHDFLRRELKGLITGVHILPFYPWSSDDGFAVINYVEVNAALGEWQDINAIARDFDLMADLVINHCSARSQWFENFKQRKHPGMDYFVEADPEGDYSEVVRPRTSPLLAEVQTLDGKRHVWCTFSHDQVDLNFENPQVLLEFIRIVRHYLDQGVKIFRLDAVAFLWKIPGTSCLNLEQTHEAVRLLRTVIEHTAPDAIIITETNIPLRENLAYFGNANEAHLVYNFSLPPLLLNTMVSGDCRALKSWMMGMPAAQDGTTYFNFIASHDGIGLRPAEGLLSDKEVGELVELMQESGGRVSWRALGNGESRPYEINISLFDAMRRSMAGGEDGYQEARFICAHALMLAIQGLPAFYIHSLLATENDNNRVEHTGHNRAVNRHQWDVDHLEQALSGDTHHARMFRELKTLIELRTKQPAFHPNAAQYPLHIGDEVFGVRRETRSKESSHRHQSLVALYNVTSQPQAVPLAELNLDDCLRWTDLLSGADVVGDAGALRLPPYGFCWLQAEGVH